MPKTITIPSAGELALNTGEVLTKLPSDAIHNHLHQLAEAAKTARENLESTELATLILCAIELEHQQKVARVQPWKEWVKSNCVFSHATATRYARVLKAARLGAIVNLYPEILTFAASGGTQAADFFTTPVLAFSSSDCCTCRSSTTRTSITRRALGSVMRTASKPTSMKWPVSSPSPPSTCDTAVR